MQAIKPHLTADLLTKERRRHRHNAQVEADASRALRAILDEVYRVHAAAARYVEVHDLPPLYVVKEELERRGFAVGIFQVRDDAAIYRVKW